MVPCLCVFLASVLPKWLNGSSWIWAKRLPSTSSTLRYTEIRISPQTMALPSETLSQTLDFEKFCCLNCRTHNKQYLLQTENQQKYTYWVAQKTNCLTFYVLICPQIGLNILKIWAVKCQLFGPPCMISIVYSSDRQIPHQTLHSNVKNSFAKKI